MKYRSLTNIPNVANKHRQDKETTMEHWVRMIEIAHESIKPYETTSYLNTCLRKGLTITDETKNFIVGVEMTLEQLKQVFNNHNISKIDPQGDKFDYNVHQAMFENETDEVEPGIIIEVMQPGWSLHDRLLRPAMVGVSKKKTNKD